MLKMFRLRDKYVLLLKSAWRLSLETVHLDLNLYLWYVLVSGIWLSNAHNEQINARKCKKKQKSRKSSDETRSTQLNWTQLKFSHVWAHLQLTLDAVDGCGSGQMQWDAHVKPRFEQTRPEQSRD